MATANETVDMSKPLLFEVAWEVANKGNLIFYSILKFYEMFFLLIYK